MSDTARCLMHRANCFARSLRSFSSLLWPRLAEESFWNLAPEDRLPAMTDQECSGSLGQEKPIPDAICFSLCQVDDSETRGIQLISEKFMRFAESAALVGDFHFRDSNCLRVFSNSAAGASTHWRTGKTVRAGLFSNPVEFDGIPSFRSPGGWGNKRDGLD